MSERKIGKAPVKRIRGNTGNSQVASDVLVEGVQILGTNARAVEVETCIVDKFAESAHIPDRHVKAACVGVASDTGERICYVRACSVVMETHVQVISRTASPALTRRVGSAPETVNQVEVEVIAVVECRCNEMEILGARTCSGHIRQREEVQQALRDRIDG